MTPEVFGSALPRSILVGAETIGTNLYERVASILVLCRPFFLERGDTDHPHGNSADRPSRRPRDRAAEFHRGLSRRAGLDKSDDPFGHQPKDKRPSVLWHLLLYGLAAVFATPTIIAFYLAIADRMILR